MKKILSFKKNLSFKTNISEITSISLENTIQCYNNKVQGDLIINGNYKITDTSTKVDPFEFKIPIEIEIDNKYITDDVVVDIDDFYYEIINSNSLEVNIDVMIDNIIEKPIIEQIKEENDVQEQQKEELVRMEKQTSEILINETKENKQSIELENNRCIEEENNNEPTKNKIDNTQINSIFDNFNNDGEIYSKYYVYIVREGDTIDSIMSKYKITRDLLNEYNDLNELKLGDKLIIPEILDAKD